MGCPTKLRRIRLLRPALLAQRESQSLPRWLDTPPPPQTLPRRTALLGCCVHRRCRNGEPQSLPRSEATVVLSHCSGGLPRRPKPSSHP